MIFRAVRDVAGKVVDFVWLMVNRAMECITGLPASAMPGNHLLDLYPRDRENGIFRHFVQTVESGEP